MDPVEDDGATAPRSGSAALEADTSSIASQRLDRALTIAVWAVGISLVLFAAFFGYRVYAQNEAARLASPALQVIDALAKQVRSKPNDPTLRSRLAEALGAAGRFDEAKRELAAAIKLDPKYVGAFENLATIELIQKDYKASSTHWQKVIDLTASGEMKDVNQRREVAFFHLGEIALLEKDYVAAVGYFNAAIRIRKDASDSYLRLAQAYAGLGQNDSAMEQIDIALQFDPRFPEAHFVRGKLFLAAGDKVDAAWDFRAALDGAAGNQEAQAALDSLGAFGTWYETAVAAASSDASAALDAVQVARAIRPESYEAAMLHGKLLEKSGDMAGAADAYAVALKVEPGDAAAAAAAKRVKASGAAKEDDE